MPRARTRSVAVDEPVVKMPTQSLVAAARRVTGRPDIQKISRTGRGWQNQAWDFFDIIGEFRYGADWIANMVSRATLYLAYDHQRATESANTSAAAAYVRALFGGQDGQGEFLRQIGLHLTVAGETFIIGTSNDGMDKWLTVAATELTVRQGVYYASGRKIESDGEPLVLRLWRPHPRKWIEATSPARAVLSVLAEIDQMTKHIFAQIDSRLAGAGVLFVPSEITLPGGEATEQGVVPGSGPDRFTKSLTDAMTASLADREDASAVVPIVVTAPGEHIANIKHVTFWSELQEQAKTLRDEAIRRLALGLDLPPEILTGTADVNHWGAWQIDESAIKAHAEPLLGIITDSLTTGYLRPLLVADGMSQAEAEHYSIEADTALLRLRPNRSQEAFELYDRGQLKSSVLVQETGFDPQSDMPDDTEIVQWFVRKVASGQTTPELVAAALHALGANLNGPIGAAPPAQARPTPSLEDHPQVGPPDVPSTPSPGQDRPAAHLEPLIVAAEPIVFRALERAGNRLRSRIGRPVANMAAAEVYMNVPVTAGQLDDLLADAFTNLDRYQICTRVPAEHLEAALDSYCRHLLLTRARHDAGVLASFLSTRLGVMV